MKKLFSLLFCFLFLSFSAQGEKLETMPELLCFSQKTSDRKYVRDQLYTQRTYPQTAHEQVNREMQEVIDSLHEKALPSLPTGRINLMPAYLDVGATIFRTGLKWMSFLSIARIAYEREQTYVDFDARVYDMETGEKITLASLFPEESEAWGLMEKEIRTQLTAYFPNEEPDAQALNALCSREQLPLIPFTLTPAKLTLHFRADALYPGRNTLMHVKIYFPEIRPLMNAYGRENTDCSMYKMIALTYDDGGARGSSNNVMDRLRRFGANATFFVVGNTMRNNHDVLCREHDAAYAVESHNYEHVYDNLTAEKIHAWKKQFDQELQSITGHSISYLRAPGGNFKYYIEYDVGYPMIRWSLNTSDAGNNNYEAIAKTVLNNAQDGDVVLMHDLNPNAFRYTEIFLPELTRQGYLCVTVDELFAHYGVPLEANIVYHGCDEVAAQQQ